jgi:phosphatidylethanolamine-binding protein (PEBP) family uncharacterized protein
MRRSSAAVSLGAMLISALAVGGCGGSGSSHGAVKVTLKSAALASRRIPTRYTCDGSNVNPPLEWGAIPKDTGELVLAAVGLTPTVPASDSFHASVEWAVAGIDPALHRLNPGALPRGAHVGLASSGKRHFNICPKKGTTEQYQFMLYGVPAGAKVAADFADEPILSVLTKPGTATSTTAEGAFVAAYTRK